MGLAGDVREMSGVPVACGEPRVCDSAGTGVLTGHWIFVGHAGRQGAFQRFPAVRLGGVSLAPKKCRWAARGMAACRLARLAGARCVRRLGVPAFCERDIA